MQSHLKKPAFAMPSTITIIPAINIIVAQFIPLELSPPSDAVYQKPAVKMLFKLSVFDIASMLCMLIPNTTSIVSPAQISVTRCRSIFSDITSANISTKINKAKICDVIVIPPIYKKLRTRVIISQPCCFVKYIFAEN